MSAGEDFDAFDSGSGRRHRRILIALVLALVIAVVAFVVAPHRPPQWELAGSFCQEQLAATFDEPGEVEFVEWHDGNYRPDRHYTFSGVASSSGGSFDVSCDVRGDPGDFRLDQYDIQPRN